MLHSQTQPTLAFCWVEYFCSYIILILHVGNWLVWSTTIVHIFSCIANNWSLNRTVSFNSYIGDIISNIKFWIEIDRSMKHTWPGPSTLQMSLHGHSFLYYLVPAIFVPVTILNSNNHHACQVQGQRSSDHYQFHTHHSPQLCWWHRHPHIHTNAHHHHLFSSPLGELISVISSSMQLFVWV